LTYKEIYQKLFCFIGKEFPGKEYKNQEVEMNINDIIKASSIKKENEKLITLLNEMGAGEALTIKTKIEEYQETLLKLTKQKESLETRITSLNKEIDSKKSEIIVLEDEILFESFALYKPKFSFQTSEEYKVKLDSCRDKQKQLIKNGTAVFANENRTVNGSKSEGRKMVNDMKKLLLRSINNEW